MFIQPIFEYLGMLSIASGLTLSGMVLSPLSLLAGLGIVVTGAAMIYVHYQQVDAQPNPFS